VNITVLAYLEPGATQPDIAIEQVRKALEAAKHKPTILAIHDDVTELVSRLRQHKPDLVFNLVESFAKDIIGGQIAVTGILDLLQLPYTGGGPGELYLQEDKALSKKLLAYEQVLYPDFATFEPNADVETSGRLRMPLFVKPLRMDASIGIDENSLVRNTTELIEQVQWIHKTFRDTALVEEYIEGREFYVSVLGNQNPVAFPPIEMDFSGLPEGSLPVMDNKAKFDESSERFQGTRAVVAELEPELKARLQRIALDAYRALRVRDYGRIDLRLAETGEIYVIEVNANCYLEEHSEFAMAAAAHGIDYVSLISRIVDLAMDRFEHPSAVKRKKRKKKPSAKNGAAATKKQAE
jgi:D-alanine-D-alanine ligase